MIGSIFQQNAYLSQCSSMAGLKMNVGKDDVGRSGRYILVWLMLQFNLHRNWDEKGGGEYCVVGARF